jgi:hypothetical protein
MHQTFSSHQQPSHLHDTLHRIRQDPGYCINFLYISFVLAAGLEVTLPGFQVRLHEWTFYLTRTSVRELIKYDNSRELTQRLNSDNISYHTMYIHISNKYSSSIYLHPTILLPSHGDTSLTPHAHSSSSSSSTGGGSGILNSSKLPIPPNVNCVLP